MIDKATVTEFLRLLYGWKRVKRDPARIERIIGKLRDVWTRPEHEDTRLMQLLMNMTTTVKFDPYFLEDDKLEELIDEYAKRYNLEPPMGKKHD